MNRDKALPEGDRRSTGKWSLSSLAGNNCDHMLIGRPLESWKQER